MRYYLKKGTLDCQDGLLINSSSIGTQSYHGVVQIFFVVDVDDEKRAARWGCPVRGSSKMNTRGVLAQKEV
jgi:hypothetical protein